MAYQALYRVWRSQRFDDVVGQQAITQTLKNAIIQHKTSHAYLFSGPRGTGKTSAAKIFAKAINCPNSVDGEPCNQCEMCRSITAGRQEDVIEIDAASNNGVEEIRFIRERANYAPTSAKYKIYIIDEVHMLSTGAFNALLKTLEEPKEHVIFILATTEPHKIPATIISRTQRFDFKRINVQDIVNHLQHILQEIDVPFEEQALFVIARAAEGGMRDALSILDQTISFSDGTVTLADAMEVTGSLTNERMDDYLESCLRQEVERALELLEEMLAEGKEAKRLLENLLLYCRDLLIYQQAPQLLAEKSVYLTDKFKTLAQVTPAEKLYEVIQVLSETQNEVRFSSHANIYLEVATVKLAAPTAKSVASGSESSAVPASQVPMPVANEELAILKKQIQELKTELQTLKQAETKPEVKEKSTPRQTTTNYRVPTERVYQVLKEATKQNLQEVKNCWEDLLMALLVTQRAMLKASEPVAAGPNFLLIAFDYEILCKRADEDQELKLALQNTLSKMIKDYLPDLVFIPKDEWPKLRGNYVNQYKSTDAVESLADDELISSSIPESNEVVEQAKSLFGDLVKIIED